VGKKDNVYVPALPTTLHELKTRIREAFVNIDQEILHNVYRRLSIGFMSLEPHVALILNFISEKFLFTKLFYLVFPLLL
jgi:hypothetical protein